MIVSWNSTGFNHRGHVTLESETVIEVLVDTRKGAIQLLKIGPRTRRLVEAGDVRIVGDAITRLAHGSDALSARQFFASILEQLRASYPKLPSYPSNGVDLFA